MKWFFLILLFPLITLANAQEEDHDDDPLSSAELGDASPFTPLSFGDGIEFHGPRNTFRMNLRFRMQNRADFNFFDQANAGGENHNFDWGVRRLRLRMNGNVYSPRLQYLLQLSFSRSDQDWSETEFPNVIRDAMILYQLSENWYVGFGQGKLPGNRQRVISSGDQQFVDRSIVNRAFNLDRDFGLQVQYRKSWSRSAFRWQGAVSSGMGRNQSIDANNRLFYITRLEYLPLGEFLRNGDYFESDLAFEPDLKINIGLTSAFLDGSARANGAVGEIYTVNGNPDQPLVYRSPWIHYADTMMKWRGYSLYLEWVKRDVANPVLNTTQALLTGQGINAQMGKMLSKRFEVAVRYSTILPENEVVSYHPRVRQWILGANYFVKGHRVKLQANLGRTEDIDTFMRLQMELGI